MNLMEQAELDNEFLIEDDVNGFGRSILLINKDGVEYNIKGQVIRRGVEIDPETGQLIAGNHSAVTVRLSSITGGELPSDGWQVQTVDSTGATVKSKAVYVMLDRTLGRATILLGK